jgi:hypothetical protein
LVRGWDILSGIISHIAEVRLLAHARRWDVASPLMDDLGRVPSELAADALAGEPRTLVVKG